MRFHRFNYASLFAIAGLGASVLLGSGCNKLKARDHLNQGVNAFKSGNYSEASDHFKTAISLDPTFDTARLYLATSYVQQYIPKAQDWNKKVIELDPKNKEAYYTLGVIPWTEFIGPDREARLNEKMRPEDPAPLKDAKERAALKDKYWASLTQGIENEKKALAVDPEYENAMAYMNLLIRYRADLQDTKEQAAADVKEADSWVEKALETQKIKAKRKAENPNAAPAK